MKSKPHSSSIKRYVVVSFYFLFLLGTNIHAQQSLEELIDSLAIVKTSEEKVRLSTRVAKKLVSTDWDRAISYIELAENEALKTSTPDQSLASVYTTKGDFFFDKDVLDITVAYYLKAYNLYKKHNLDQEVAITENNIAIIYAQLNNPEKALKYFKNVYAYHLKKNDSGRVAKVLNNIGTLMLEKKSDSALYYFKASEQIAQRVSDTLLKTYVYTNLGRAYSNLKATQDAYSYLNKAVRLVEDKEDETLKKFVFESVASYYKEVGPIDSSIVYAKRAITLNKDNLYSFGNRDMTYLLYTIYKEAGDYEQAVTYSDLHTTINDSLNIEEKAINVERLKLQQEYKVRTQLNTLLEEQRRSRYIVIGLGLLAGILVLLILLIRYRNKITKTQLEKKLLSVQQQELKQRLEAKNKLLISKAMTEIHRTEIIEEILKDLKQVKRKAVKKETQQAIDYVLKSLQRDLNSNIWEEFELSFEQVHQSFCETLQKKHPTLTPKDRRLCCLLYLDLTSKEIASITGQTFKSIENARTRLRKKLALTNAKVNLSNYLNGLA